MLKVSSPEILEYRKAIEERKLDLPIWERKVITCEEAAAYTGISGCFFARLLLVKKQPLIPVLVLKDLEKWHWRKVVIFQSQMEHRF